MGHAARAPWAGSATRRPRRADERAQLHQPLVERGRRRCAIDEILRGRPEPSLRGTLSRVHDTTLHPKQHARHVAVDDGSAFAMHDAGNRASGVATDPWQGDEFGCTLRHRAVEPGHARLRCLVQSTGAAVVAKPLPQGEDLVLLRGRERSHRGPACDERLEPLDHPTDLRLLQHALADEGAITAPLAPPRKIPRVLGEPPFDGRRQPLCRG